MNTYTSFKISGGQLLLMSIQQACFKRKGFSAEDVDLEEGTAWKNSRFIFDNEGRHRIIRKVSVWYNVDVEFENKNKS